MGDNEPPAGPEMEAGKKLSGAQKWILDWLLAYTEEVEKKGTAYQKDMLIIWGMDWQPAKAARRRGEPWDRTAAATVSRALARLETRGLVIRNNQTGSGPASSRSRMSLDEPAPRRTDCIKLTDLGRKVAKRLTKTD